MQIKVCGMRDPGNIKAVASLGVDMMGWIFYPKSPRYVDMVSSEAGIIPDYPADSRKRAEPTNQENGPRRVGVFVDDMPQNIVTRVYNYRLDYVQLHGSESTVMIENLKRTLVPDIAPHIKVIKAFSVASGADLQACTPYEGVADLFLFDTPCEEKGGSGKHFNWEVAYTGRTPFLLSGGIGPDDADEVLAFRHPRFAGIDLNSRFETAPAVKDVELLRTFISKIRKQA